MKPIKTIRGLVLLAVLAAGAAGCSKESTLPIDAPDNTPSPITITIADGGYAASSKLSSGTRAAENGYITEFTAGDRIGLYIVRPDGSYAHENTALTLTDTGGGMLVWQTPAGTTLHYEGSEASYYAYYPYQTALSGDLNAAATTPTEFFADAVAQWTPATDQSTYALYTASDLMIGRGVGFKTGQAYTLAFTMSHAMALVVIETPVTKYTLATDSSYTWTSSAYDTAFDGFTPYGFSASTYRYLVKPNQRGASDLVGSFSAEDNNLCEYAISPNNIEAATYVLNKVDGGNTTIIPKSHILQAGDFYMKDGSMVGRDDALSETQKADCIAVVFWVGDPTNSTDGDPLLATQHADCKHGLAVALHHPGRSSNWSIEVEDITVNWLKNQGTTYGITSLKTENRMQGFANTKVLEAYNSQLENELLTVLPIVDIEQYRTDHPTPDKSSDWYWPSIQEYIYLCGDWGDWKSSEVLDLVNKQFVRIGGSALELAKYWSSSEGPHFPRSANCISFDYCAAEPNFGKDRNLFRTRAIVAF